MARDIIAEIIEIDDTWLPGIADYKYTLEDIDSENTQRSETGVMNREIVRAKVYHADVMHKCTSTEMLDVCAAIKDNATITANVLCPGKTAGEPYTELTLYVSKFENQLILYKDPNGNEEMWWQINYNLVEV